MLISANSSPATSTKLGIVTALQDADEVLVVPSHLTTETLVIDFDANLQTDYIINIEDGVYANTTISLNILNGGNRAITVYLVNSSSTEFTISEPTQMDSVLEAGGKVLLKYVNREGATLVDIGGGSTALTGTGLEKITEGGEEGYRLVGKDPDYYGDIGNHAIDLSYSNAVSDERGATYTYAFAEGYGTQSSNFASHAEGEGAVASHYAAHAEGKETVASGFASHAEGKETVASGLVSHTEGEKTVADGSVCHAEGYATVASARTSHAEGTRTVASNYCSHAEGRATTASGVMAHAEGKETTASGYASHAEGRYTTTSGEISHAEGTRTVASGTASHAEGAECQATIYCSHAEGRATTASGTASHAEGAECQATNYCAHAEGYKTTASGSYGSHAEGMETTALNEASHAAGKFNVGTSTDTIHETGIGEEGDRKNAFEIYTDGTLTAPEATNTSIEARGNRTLITKEYLEANSATGLERITENDKEGWSLIGVDRADHIPIGADAIDFTHPANNGKQYTESGASGSWAVAFGYGTKATAFYSAVFGTECVSSGVGAVSAGWLTEATGDYSIAVGSSCHAGGNRSQAFGGGTTASGSASHAEGAGCQATNYCAHAEGKNTTASGDYGSHAEGYSTIASGDHAHAEGYVTIALNDSSHAAGKYNTGTSTDTIHETGIGANDSNRKNAFEIYIDGTLTAPEATNTLIEARGNRTLITKEYIDIRVPELPTTDGDYKLNIASGVATWVAI